MTDVSGATFAAFLSAVAASISAVVATAMARAAAKKSAAELASKNAELLKVADRHRESLELTQYIHITQRVFDLGNLFIEHPLLRKYFYEDGIVDSTEDVQKITSLAVYILDFYSTLQEAKALLTEALPSWEEWNRYIEDGFRRSPYLCYYFEQHMPWYDQSLAAIYNKVAIDRQEIIRKQRTALAK